jgi:hypothetical protein
MFIIVVISYHTVIAKISVTKLLTFFSFLQRTFELTYKFFSYEVKGTTSKNSLITMFLILNDIQYFIHEYICYLFTSQNSGRSSNYNIFKFGK